MQQRTLIIVPAFNEEEALPGVLASLRSGLPDFDVLVVDDGSQDRTAEVARENGARVAQLPFNLGIGGAVRTGFRYAVANGYQRAVQFDADGQHAASEVAALLSEIDQGADLVIGSRFAARDSSYRTGQIRARAMGVLRLGMFLLSGHRFTDTSSGFRAFSRPMLEFFARTYPVEYMESVEALLLACYAGFKIAETPVVMNERSGGAPSQRSFKLAYHYIRLVLVLAATASPHRRRAYERSR